MLCVLGARDARGKETLMTTYERSTPSERDIAAVEGHLAALYADLPPEQRAVLETVIAAGLEQLEAAGNDTTGFGVGVEALFQGARIIEIQRAWTEAAPADAGDAATQPGGTRASVLAPVLAVFRRVTAAPAQPRPAGESPA